MSDSGTPWTAACQASLSFTISWNLLNFMSTELVMPSNHLILCHPLLLLPSIWVRVRVRVRVRVFSNELASRSFPMSRLFASDGQSTGASASASVLPVNIQGGFPFGWTGWISLLSKGLPRVFSNTAVQKHQFLGARPLWSNSHICT